ncbi:MAG TPA: hypothetical protein VNU95_10515 [Candidatus Acidoferrales bacterium]|jgi:hypothetical protein|nr:hypothetical protein [Candidatus Acidoferrales bacterium]
MKSRLFKSITICVLFLIGVAGYGQKQDATAPPADESAQSPDQGTGATPGAPHVDPSQSPIADPASPLYGWEKFSSAEGKFSAIFPVRPKEDDQSKQGQSVEVQMHLFLAGKDAQTAYGAGYYDLSRVDDPKMVLARMEESMVKRHNAKITSYKPIQVDNHSGTEFEFVFGDKPELSSTVRLISDGLRVYILLAIFQTAHPNPEERDAFFNSFAMQ